MGTPFSVVERLDGDRCVAYCNQDCNAKQDDKETATMAPALDFRQDFRSNFSFFLSRNSYP